MKIIYNRRSEKLFLYDCLEIYWFKFFKVKFKVYFFVYYYDIYYWVIIKIKEGR